MPSAEVDVLLTHHSFSLSPLPSYYDLPTEPWWIPEKNALHMLNDARVPYFDDVWRRVLGDR